MKFSKETLNILKNFSGINNSIMLRPGSFIMTKAVSGVNYAEANISDTISDEIGIYDLNNFLAGLALLGEDSEISLDVATATITIQNDKTSIFYPAADASTIVTPKKPLQMPVADIIFELKAEDLQQLLRATRVMSVDTLAITNKAGKILINGYNKVTDQSLSRALYSLEVGEYEGDNKFFLLMNKDNLKMLPMDFKVLVSAKGAVKFENAEASYVVVLEADSESDF